jgi:hypothetical protein
LQTDEHFAKSVLIAPKTLIKPNKPTAKRSKNAEAGV